MKSNRLTSKQTIPKRIRELSEEREDLIDYLDMLEARARNFGRKHYSTKQVEKMLRIKWLSGARCCLTSNKSLKNAIQFRKNSRSSNLTPLCRAFYFIRQIAT